MSSQKSTHNQEHLDQVFLHALRALPLREIPAVEAQIMACKECQQESERLRPIIRSFAGWSTDVLRPSVPLWDQIAHRITRDTGKEPFIPPLEPSAQPEWEEAAPGIHVKILARDTAKGTVSMLVRLDPGTDYPGHIHAGTEELHLIHGVLQVDDRTLYPGDFIHAEAGSVDHRVRSDTGCTCFLMTSASDALL